MLKLQRIYASEAAPWNQTTGSRQMTFDIDSQDVADLSKSYIVLRTSLDVGTNPVKDCIRLPSFGYVNDVNAPALPVAYSASSMLRDVRLDTEKQGTLEAISFNNYRIGGMRPFTVSVAANRTRSIFGEGWSPLFADNGADPAGGESYYGEHNSGNYWSAWTNTQRTGAVASTYTPYVDMCVPLSEYLGLGKMEAIDMSQLGRTSLSCNIEEQATLTTIFARSAATGYEAYDYVYVDGTHITVETSARNAENECPFWVGMGLACTQAGVTVATLVEGIAIANTGVVTLTIDADAVADGTLLELDVDAAETVTWSITRASLILATHAKMTLKRPMKPQTYYFKTWVDIPYNPNTTTLLSNSFSLPPGTIAAFFVIGADNAGNALVTSWMGSLARARFALNNKDITNRSMQTLPASALYHDQLAQALVKCDTPISSLDEDMYTVLPACSMAPTNPGDQLLLTLDFTNAFPGGRCHLFCLVERAIVM